MSEHSLEATAAAAPPPASLPCTSEAPQRKLRSQKRAQCVPICTDPGKREWEGGMWQRHNPCPAPPPSAGKGMAVFSQGQTEKPNALNNIFFNLSQ